MALPHPPRPRIHLTQAEFDAFPLKQEAMQGVATKSGWFRDSENPGHIAWFNYVPPPRPQHDRDVWTLYPVVIIPNN